MHLLSNILFIFVSLFLLLIPTTSVCSSESAELTSITIRINEGKIVVNTNLTLPQSFFDEINQGVNKEIILYVDLFREWNFWPDEFVKGVKIIRVMKSNPIKREYVGTSQIGNVITERRFNDVKKMIEWACSINELTLSNIKEHEQGVYYVKVTAESRIQKIPPLFGYLFFFIPDKEIKVTKNSEPFQIR